jgi:hypothetical protein
MSTKHKELKSIKKKAVKAINGALKHLSDQHRARFALDRDYGMAYWRSVNSALLEVYTDSISEMQSVEQEQPNG